MADIIRVGRPTLSTGVPPSNARAAGLRAGEKLLAGQLFYIKASNGRAYRALAAGAADERSNARGVVAEETEVGKGVTMLRNVNIGLSSGLTPGANLYVSAVTPGEFADAPGYANAPAVAFCFDDTRIHAHF